MHLPQWDVDAALKEAQVIVEKEAASNEGDEKPAKPEAKPAQKKQ